MAILVNQEGSVEFKFIPYRISEGGNPTWVSTQIVFEAQKNKEIDNTLSVTMTDLDELINGLYNLISGNIKKLEIVSTDDNFIFRAFSKIENKNFFTIEFMFGENVFMKGYRFIVTKKGIGVFFEELRINKVNLKPKGELI